MKWRQQRNRSVNHYHRSTAHKLYISIVFTLIISSSNAFSFGTLSKSSRAHIHQFHRTTHLWSSTVQFSSPLLDAGYPPAVMEAEEGSNDNKPILLYLPGFDGTLLAPFLQFPKLSTSFDVRGMSVDMEDRSTFQELSDMVLNYINGTVQENNDRPMYLMGESFGGILACHVALRAQECSFNLKGLILINPATSYTRSNLATEAPSVSKLPYWRYPLGILQKLVPLFGDEYFVPQLLQILSGQALPSVINTPAREAYMGRTAFTLPYKLKFMPRDTLAWRLSQWLQTGCETVNKMLEEDCTSGVKSVTTLPQVLIVVGGADETLPSVSEADRLSLLIPNVRDVFVVEGAGHATTCGNRVDLAAVIFNSFDELCGNNASDNQVYIAETENGTNLGMVPRYDDVKGGMGLSPALYWTQDNFRKYKKSDGSL